MKHTLLFFLILPVFLSKAQPRNADWIPAKIVFKNESVLNTEVMMDNQFFEGTLIAKDQGKLATFSPHSVRSFTLNPKDSESLIFESIPTVFLKAKGIVDSFVNPYYPGTQYSLYKKRIPDKNRIFAGSPDAWVYVGYIQSEVILLIGSRNYVRQVSQPSSKNYDRKKYKVDKTAFLDAFGENSIPIKKFIKKKHLNIRRIADIKMVIDFANTL